MVPPIAERRDPRVTPGKAQTVANRGGPRAADRACPRANRAALLVVTMSRSTGIIDSEILYREHNDK